MEKHFFLCFPFPCQMNSLNSNLIDRVNINFFYQLTGLKAASACRSDIRSYLRNESRSVKFPEK